MGVYQITPEIKYYIDDVVAGVLNKKRQLVHKKDRDYFMIVDGEEGTGKSTLAFQLAKFLDPNFNLDQVAFNGKEFLDCIAVAKKGQAIVFDEAFTGLSARTALSQINKLLVETIMEVRKKNLFVFIVLPSVYYLDRYVVLSRAKVLFHCYFREERRGKYSVYSKSQIKMLNTYGRKTMSYSFPKPRHRAEFTGRFALDIKGDSMFEELYEKKKIDAINKKNKGRNGVKWEGWGRVAIKMMIKMGKTRKEIMDSLESNGYVVPERTYTDMLMEAKKEMNQEAEQKAEEFAQNLEPLVSA